MALFRIYLHNQYIHIFELLKFEIKNLTFFNKVLGKKGRGLTEHFNVPISDVDLIVGSLEHSFSSIGGFCVGSHFIVEHQRLSGLGISQI